VIDPETAAREMTTSRGVLVVTDAPEGVAADAWEFRTATASRGAVVFIPENSQTTAPAFEKVALGVIVIVVPPG
jgi:hypothetical protein